IAIGLPPSPYPLGGEGRDVVDDVNRLGGFGIAAHPAAQRAAPRWTEWTAPFGGLEWVSGDSQWREAGQSRLMRSVFGYPFRFAEALSALLNRSDAVMSRWDALTQRRRVVAVAAPDARARVNLRAHDNRFALPVPGYATAFETLSIAIPGLTLTRRADADAH